MLSSVPSLKVPLFIWQEPPDHFVTATYLSLEHDRLITGSDRGHICLWLIYSKFLEKSFLEPQILVFTREAEKIIDFLIIRYEGEDRLLSLSSKGSIAIINLDDGKCIVSKSNFFSFSPTRLVALPQCDLVAVCGLSFSIEILNISTLKIDRVVSFGCYWYHNFDWTNRNSNIEYICLTKNGIFLRAPALNSNSSVSTFDPGLKNSRNFRISPSKYFCLYIADDQVIVYELSKFKKILSFSRGEGLWEACWCDDLTFIVYSKALVGYIHRIPRSFRPKVPQNNVSDFSIISINLTSKLCPSISLPKSYQCSLNEKSKSTQEKRASKTSRSKKKTTLSDLFKFPSWKPNTRSFEAKLVGTLILPHDYSIQGDISMCHCSVVDNFIYLVLGGGNIALWVLPFIWNKEDLGKEFLPTKMNYFAKGWEDEVPIKEKISEKYHYETENSDEKCQDMENLKNDIMTTSTLLSPSPTTHSAATLSILPKTDEIISSSNSVSSPSLLSLSEPLFEKDSKKRLETIIGYHNSQSDFFYNENDILNNNNNNNDIPSSFETRKITCSLLLEEELDLVTGDDLGYISIRKLPMDSKSNSWKAHKKTVSALIKLSDQYRKLLISGSHDHYIKIWDLDSFPIQLVKSFLIHGGPVTRLLSVPSTYVNKIWKNRFFSISSDRSVGLLQVDSIPFCVNKFQTHPGDILDIRWKLDFDYLVVKCSNNSILVWEISSSQLDRHITGPEVEHVWNQSQSFQVKITKDPLPNLEKSILGFNFPIINEPSLQGILLNTKNILLELNESMQKIKNSVTDKFSCQKLLDENLGMRISLEKASKSCVLKKKDSKIIEHIENGNRDIYINAKILPSYFDIFNNVNLDIKKVNSFLGSKSFLIDPVYSDGSLSTNENNHEDISFYLRKIATDFAPYRICTYLIPWNINSDLDKFMMSKLCFKIPKIPVSYGRIGDKGVFSVLTPKFSKGPGRWVCSETMSAIHSLVFITIINFLFSFKSNQLQSDNDFIDINNTQIDPSQISLYFCNFLLKEIPDIIPSSLMFLSSYWCDPMLEIMEAARLLFKSVIESLSVDQIKVVTNYCYKIISDPCKSSNKYLQTIFTLGILASVNHKWLTSNALSLVSQNIFKLVLDDSNFAVRHTAIELFGRGFDSWCQIFPESKQILCDLINNCNFEESNGISNAILNTLGIIGKSNAYLFMQIVAKRITHITKKNRNYSSQPTLNIKGIKHLEKPRRTLILNTLFKSSKVLKNFQEQNQLLILLCEIVKNYSVNFLPELPLLLEILMKSINPHIHELRDATLENAMDLVHILVDRYPMVDYDPFMNKLALGTLDGKVLIYELNTATKIYSINSHAPYSISALSLSGRCKVLATYSLQDSTLKIWKSNLSILGIISGKFELYASLTISYSKNIYKETKGFTKLLDGLKLSFIDSKTLKLTRSWENPKFSIQKIV